MFYSCWFCSPRCVHSYICRSIHCCPQTMHVTRVWIQNNWCTPVSGEGAVGTCRVTRKFGVKVMKNFLVGICTLYIKWISSQRPLSDSALSENPLYSGLACWSVHTTSDINQRAHVLALRYVECPRARVCTILVCLSMCVCAFVYTYTCIIHQYKLNQLELVKINLKSRIFGAYTRFQNPMNPKLSVVYACNAVEMNVCLCLYVCVSIKIGDNDDNVSWEYENHQVRWLFFARKCAHNAHSSCELDEVTFISQAFGNEQTMSMELEMGKKTTYACNV